MTSGEGDYRELLNVSDLVLLASGANVSLAELECYFGRFNQTDKSALAGQLTCNSSWDGVLCWPSIAAGSSATMPCFSELNDVFYDTSQNASRECYGNGTWAEKTDYSYCKPLKSDSDFILGVLWDLRQAATVYYVGYGLSLVALLLALWIFLYFKDLRCLRNVIHTNLMVTYVLIDITWIATAILQSQPPGIFHDAACVLVIFLTYLMITNFFWMFVEGLYLYILVVKTFSIEFVKFWVYALIGWGIPAVVVTTWALVKAYYSSVLNEIIASKVCVWQNRDLYDYIFVCPVILVLLINIFFLAEIMWVLITKLRAATSVESKQYRKAAKALLVLIPLLGITYVVVIVTPTQKLAKVIFTYLQATLLSTQGLTVAILYCFLNAEVRNTLRHHLERWKTQRGFGRTTRHSLTYRTSLQPGEGVRLYNNRGYRERGSCMSFTTTTSCVGNACQQCSSSGLSSQHRNSNGSYGPLSPREESNLV